MAQISIITNTLVPNIYILTYHPFLCILTYQTDFYPIFGHPLDTKSCFMIVSIILFSHNQGNFSSPIHIKHFSCHHSIHPLLLSVPNTPLIKSMLRIPFLLAVVPFSCWRRHKFPGRWQYLGSHSLINEQSHMKKKSSHHFLMSLTFDSNKVSCYGGFYYATDAVFSNRRRPMNLLGHQCTQVVHTSI